jgi:hypothetical protein
MPMIVGKHERTLAIDGPYIHVRLIIRTCREKFPLLTLECVYVRT